MIFSAHITPFATLNIFTLAVLCSPQLSPQNGFTNCSGFMPVDTVCSFGCGFNYELVGNQSIKCINDFGDETQGKWTSEPPTCNGNSKK